MCSLNIAPSLQLCIGYWVTCMWHVLHPAVYQCKLHISHLLVDAWSISWLMLNHVCIHRHQYSIHILHIELINIWWIYWVCESQIVWFSQSGVMWMPSSMYSSPITFISYFAANFSTNLSFVSLVFMGPTFVYLWLTISNFGPNWGLKTLSNIFGLSVELMWE